MSKKLRRHLTKNCRYSRKVYFEAKYTDRFTPNNVIGKLFPELTEEVSQKIEAPIFGSHLSSRIAKCYTAAA